MSTIVTRAGKGSALTHNEVDANFTNLNTDKIEAAQTVTLTNKTISGSDNTLSNIGNSSLTNSSLTIGSTSVSLGSTATTVSGLTLSSPTVSGGTINNAVIGGTTPAAITGTTITANTSFSGALNGSVGATTPSTGSFTSLTDSGNLTFTGTGNRITGDFSNTTAANRVMFQTNTTNGNTEVAAIPSGTGTTGGFRAFNNSDPTNSAWAGIGSANSGTEARITSGILGTGTYLPMTFYTNGSERMRIDTSGNVGIGTSSPSGKFNVQDSVAAGRANITLLNNAAGNTSNRMRIRMAASSGFSGTDLYPYIEAYEENAANAAEGLAFGTYNGTSLGERMRINSSGNVGIGTSSPDSYSGRSTLSVNGSTGGIITLQANGTQRLRLFTGASSSIGSLTGALDISTGDASALTFGTNSTERARIDSSGNVGIGTASPLSTSQLTVASKSLSVTGSDGNFSSGGARTFVDLAGTLGRVGVLDGGAASATSLAFFTGSGSGGNAERARIDSSGNLLVGTASVTAGADTGFKVIANGGGGAADRAQIGSSISNNSGLGYTMYSTGAAAYRFYVGYGGTIFATSTTISAISDQRFKENIRDLDTGLDSIMALKPRLYDWKEGKGANIKNARGFIAQEFEQVFPDLIDEWADPAPEGEEPYKSVRQDLIPVLVKAIQEQQAMIEELKAKVAALENK